MLEAQSAGAAGLEGSQSCGTMRTKPQPQGWGRLTPSLALGWRKRRVRKAGPTPGEQSQQLPGPVSLAHFYHEAGGAIISPFSFPHAGSGCCYSWPSVMFVVSEPLLRAGP